MPELIETTHAGGFILSEANGSRSRDIGTQAAEQTFLPGQVLGQLAADDTFVVLDPAGADGSEAAAAIAYGASSTGTGETVEITLMKRDMEAIGGELVWPEGISDPEKATAIAELAALGILVR